MPTSPEFVPRVHGLLAVETKSMIGDMELSAKNLDEPNEIVQMGPAGSNVVGREEELASLARWLASPVALPGAFVLEGEVGIGKTTLWRRGVELAAAASYRLVSCSPSESETRLPFTGIGDLLEPVIAQAIDTLPEPQRRALRVALLLEEGEGPPPDPRAVPLAFLGAIRALASYGPLLVAIDDVQWLDEPSAFALEFMLRRLRDDPSLSSAGCETATRDLQSVSTAPSRMPGYGDCSLGRSASVRCTGS